MVRAKPSYSTRPTDLHGCSGMPLRRRASCTRHATTRYTSTFPSQTASATLESVFTL